MSAPWFPNERLQAWPNLAGANVGEKIVFCHYCAFQRYGVGAPVYHFDCEHPLGKSTPFNVWTVETGEKEKQAEFLRSSGRRHLAETVVNGTAIGCGRGRK